MFVWLFRGWGDDKHMLPWSTYDAFMSNIVLGNKMKMGGKSAKFSANKSCSTLTCVQARFPTVCEGQGAQESGLLGVRRSWDSQINCIIGL